MSTFDAVMSVFRLVVAIVALVACLVYWLREDYPKATWYGVFYLILTRPTP